MIPPRDAPFVAPHLGARRRRAHARGRRGAARHARLRHLRRAGCRRGSPTTRTLHSVPIEEDGDELRALFRGDGFLRGMVRSICGVLADAARGRVAAGARGASCSRRATAGCLSAKARGAGPDAW